MITGMCAISDSVPLLERLVLVPEKFAKRSMVPTTCACVIVTARIKMAATQPQASGHWEFLDT